MADTWDSRRRTLGEINNSAWNGSLKFDTKLLDSSLKKNTAYIKKLKVIKRDNEASLIEGVHTLSLEKYLSELIPSLATALLEVSKNDDITTAVELVSVLHQRFTTQFTPQLISVLLEYLATPTTASEIKLTETRGVGVPRNVLRLLMEFYLCRIFRSFEDINNENLELELPKFVVNRIATNSKTPVIPVLLKEVLGYDLTSGTTIPIATAFLKRFSDDFLVDKHTDTSIIPLGGRTIITDVFIKYSNAIGTHLKELYRSILSKSNRSRKVSMKTGKVGDDIALELDAQKEVYGRLNTYYEFAMGYLTELKPLKLDTQKWNVQIATISPEELLLIWGTDENRKFYEDTIDVATIAESKNKSDLSGLDAELMVHISEMAVKIGHGSSKGDQMKGILASLDEAQSGKEVDDLALLYWYLDLHNRASMHMILEHFCKSTDSHRYRYYGRFLKTNEYYMEDLIGELTERLDSRFRGQVYSKGINFGVINCFSELFKFKLMPIYVFFHKIRGLILHIQNENNMIILSQLFENCGKVLLYDPEYKVHTNDMIELLKYVRKTHSLSIADRNSINYFISSLNPKPLNSIKRQELSDEELFLRHLFRKEIETSSATSIAKLLFQLDWTDDKIRKLLVNTFTEPEHVNYESIPEFVKVFKLVSTYDASIGIQAMDLFFDKITIQLEENSFKFNRVRMTQMKYLADLQNSLVLNSTVVIPLLYKILCFGHLNNNPSRDEICQLDLPDDYFRIQLIALFITSIDFERLPKFIYKKFKMFLRFFDYYIMTKMLPLPIEINFKLDGMYANVKPEFDRSMNFAEAIGKLQQEMNASSTPEEQEEEEVQVLNDEEDQLDLNDVIEGINKDQQGGNSDDDDSDDDSDDSSDDDENNNSEEVKSADDSDEDDTEDESDDDDDAGEDEDEDDANNDDEEENALMNEKFQRRKAIEEAIEQSVQKEFDSLVIDALTRTRKINPPTKIKLPSLNESSNDIDEGAVPSNGARERIKFKLATRNNNNLIDLKIPENNKLADNLRKRMDNERKQKEMIKKIVLDSMIDD